MDDLEAEVRGVLERGIKITEELDWCLKAEEVLYNVLEGITTRYRELENEE